MRNSEKLSEHQNWIIYLSLSRMSSMTCLPNLVTRSVMCETIILRVVWIDNKELPTKEPCVVNQFLSLQFAANVVQSTVFRTHVLHKWHPGTFFLQEFTLFVLQVFSCTQNTVSQIPIPHFYDELALLL